MVDWIAIASASVSVLTLFLTKAGEKISEKAGESIFELIKRKFKNDEEAKTVLEKYIKKPERYTSALVDIIREKAETDTKFGLELKKLVDSFIDSPSNKITQIAVGTGNAQVIGSGKASVSIGKKRN